MQEKSKGVCRVILGLLCAGISHPAIAASMSDKDVSAAFCPAISDPASYDNKSLDHYAMLMPGKEGWIFRTKNDFRSDWSNKPETIQQLKLLQDSFQKKNATLVIVIPPVRGMADAENLSWMNGRKFNKKGVSKLWSDYESSMQALRQNGISVVGVTKQDDVPNFFYKRNHHWSPEGARVTAGKVAEAIKAMPVYTQIPNVEYETKHTGQKQYKSSFGRAFKSICGTDLPPETAETYETSKKNAASNADDILGDTKNPQIVLLGTSNSVPEASTANFEGFLKEYLSADILNLSIEGAGIDDSIISYINSDHFKSPEPKIVIWEIPGYYKLNEMGEKLFGQLTATAHGDCQANALFQNNIPLSGPESLIFDSAASYGLGENSYVHLKFTSAGRNKIALKFGYKNGSMKKIIFQNGKKTVNNGDFYTMVPGKAASLQNIKIAVPAKLNGQQVKAQVCPL